MNPFGRGFGFGSQTSGDNTRPIAPGSGSNPQSFTNLLNQPYGWDPNMYNVNMGGSFGMPIGGGFGQTQVYGSSQMFGSSNAWQESVPETQGPVEEEEPVRGKAPARRHTRKETGGRAKKNVIPWTDHELYSLTRAWVDVSEDPEVGKIYIFLVMLYFITYSFLNGYLFKLLVCFFSQLPIQRRFLEKSTGNIF